MSEEAVETPSSEPPINPEEKAFKALHQEGLQLFAQAGEAQFIIANNRKKLTKINFQLRKLDKKIGTIIQHQKAMQAAKEKASPDLKVVPSDAV